MDRYKLIGLDQMEASIVRRHLHRWGTADEQTIRPLITALQQTRSLSNVHIREPRWETNVYPLYYYWAHHHNVTHKEVYERVLASLPRLIPSDLRMHVARAADTEIDILVEDGEYFVFIEAKIPADDRKVKFEKTRGVHQLVRQYIQGRILQTLIGKTFALATIGANHEQTIEIPLNATEKKLLHAVGEERQLLEIPDLPWGLLSATPNAGATS